MHQALGPILYDLLDTIQKVLLELALKKILLSKLPYLLHICKYLLAFLRSSISSLDCLFRDSELRITLSKASNRFSTR